MSLNLMRLVSSQVDFAKALRERTQWQGSDLSSVDRVVAEIIEAVQRGGDAELARFTAKFDRWQVSDESPLLVSKADIEAAYDACPSEQIEALQIAASRVREYHAHQVQESWSYRDSLGNLLGQQVTPISSAGIYVPGGKASYPSSVLMNAIPAKVAGVDKVVMVTPTPDGDFNPLVFAAAKIAEVDMVFRVGGAQAVSALAYGTESIPAVDKIVGPGNIYVAAAKRQLFGTVGIDMVAGPSEILVIADGSVSPEWIAMDLLSQAEHDEVAQSILISPDAAYLEKVAVELERLLNSLERRGVALASVENKGLFIQVADIAEAVLISNQIAPEHLELAVDSPDGLLPQIKNAGAIFLGAYSPEAVGDYCAGPNHVLPTSATARFSSPLGVYDFQKRTSIIGCSKQGGSELAKIASVLARSESLTAHAKSAEYRIDMGDSN